MPEEPNDYILPRPVDATGERRLFRDNTGPLARVTRSDGESINVWGDTAFPHEPLTWNSRVGQDAPTEQTFREWASEQEGAKVGSDGVAFSGDADIFIALRNQAVPWPRE